MRSLVAVDRGPVPIHTSLLPYLGAFLFTLVPFYHGALRHLDATYVERRGAHVRAGALLADFVILFLEGCVFLTLSLLLPYPLYFIWTLAALLLLDSAWGFMAHLAFTQHPYTGNSHGRWKPESRWAILNAVTVAALAVYLVGFDMFPPASGPGNAKLAIGALCFTFLRTILDYAWCWEFYYPSARDEQEA